MKANRYLRVLALWGGIVLAGLVMGVAGAYLYLDPQIPSASSYRDLRLQTPLRILAADGTFIAEYGERRRIPLHIDEMPDLFVRAVLDTEDKRFYSHPGIDFVTLLKATAMLIANPDEIGPGASTITMQLARNISFSLDQTFLRKFKEMLLAVKLENELTKDQILELYLNMIPFGKRAYGGEAAALTYYGKPLAELDLAQWAMLAGIPKAPTAGNPVNGPERALRRRNLVLANMLSQGSIDPAAYEAARARPITARVHARQTELDAAWIAEEARRQALELYGPGLYEDGIVVHTTVDPKIQRAATRALRSGLEAYDRRHGWRGAERLLAAPPAGEPLDAGTRDRWQETLRGTTAHGGQVPALVTALDADGVDALLADGEIIRLPLEAMRWARPWLTVNRRGRRLDTPADLLERGQLIRLQRSEDGWALGQLPDIQGAAVALRPEDGAIQALVGGYDFSRNQFNHALQAARQPGSNFKPFVYSAALDAGRTPASMYLDAPLVFRDENLEDLYRPKNDSGDFAGPTRLRRALYRSVNLVSMRILLDVGVDRVIDYVTRFGFDTRTFPRNLQLAIGGGTMALTPMEMARAFAVFANGGFRIEPWLIDRITRNGEGEIFVARPAVACDASCEARRASAGVMAPPRPGEEHPVDPLEQAPRVLEERLAYIMHAMLGDVIQYGTGRRARSLERTDLGGKTGTTNEADTWFSGYQRSLAATVWVGFSNNRPVGNNEFGSSTALPVWIELMETALEDVPEYVPQQPPGLVRMRIDPDTGLPAAPDDPDAIVELFREENAPAPASGQDDKDVRPETIF